MKTDNQQIDITNFPVMAAKCSTCPFQTDEHGRYKCPDVTNRIISRILSNCSQICHHPRFAEKPETHLCRGARDYQLEIFYRLGVITAPTDEAWKAKLAEQDNGSL
ncbi:hypothetical protein HW132_36360 [Brasilonema sp. CT11]|nr:hypothetical protein [Brasilonema sp. CT11]